MQKNSRFDWAAISMAKNEQSVSTTMCFGAFLFRPQHMREFCYSELLQTLTILIREWLSVSKDFVVALSYTQHQYNSVLYLVHISNKMAHFVSTMNHLHNGEHMLHINTTQWLLWLTRRLKWHTLCFYYEGKQSVTFIPYSLFTWNNCLRLKNHFTKWLWTNLFARLGAISKYSIGEHFKSNDLI
jgi:hypothetical protein